ncbi:N-6 DNA methylase [Methanocaldococcus indicus]|uniref:N-6 DNA methylase n=1 Tax=Methanocaldococcus indicus TaxID=213231 RepID=UPI003C6D46EB
MLEPRFIKAYEILKEKFGYFPFTYENAEKVLKVKYENVAEVLSKLVNAGYLEKKQDSKDKRKKIYRIVDKMEKINRLTKDKLISLLKQGADLIRTQVDYKVLLLFLFYKAISDIYLKTVEKLREEHKDLDDEDVYILANEEVLELYDIENNKLYTWNNVKNSPEEFINALNRIVELNRGKLEGLQELIRRTGLPSLFENENKYIVQQLIDLFSKVDLSSVDYDILGDAYEWILNYFAPTKAKEGEVYTPKEVNKLLAYIIEPKDGDIILDPACGSASMLIEQYKFNNNVVLVGQERNEVTGILAKLNIILHGITPSNAKIFIGDSLVNPKFESFLKELKRDKANKVVANPPWNQDGYTEDVLKNNPKHSEIYKYGFPNKNSADWAWIQLINYYTQEKAGIVIDTGALFRGGRERAIRKKFVDEDLIDAVILLPEKIFYNAQAPGIILVLNKNKSEERKGKILFINASNEYINHPEIRRLNKLSDENIEKIAKAYKKFKDVDGFCKVVDIEEIKKNDYNLNVSLYVSPIEEGEEIDLKEVYNELNKLHNEYLNKFEVVKSYLEEINKIG